jgi:hypothetical protein
MIANHCQLPANLFCQKGHQLKTKSGWVIQAGLFWQPHAIICDLDQQRVLPLFQ